MGSLPLLIDEDRSLLREQSEDHGISAGDTGFSRRAWGALVYFAPTDR